MDGMQMNVLLSMDQYTSKYFKGLAMRDSEYLPGIGKKRCLYILNTDTEEGRGEHWCVLFYKGSEGEFFDPFGCPPEIYGFEKLLKLRKCKKFRYNSVPVQDLKSIACGHHCLFYAFHRCRGEQLSDILKKYNECRDSDAMVIEYIRKFGNIYLPNTRIGVYQ
jgi:hypothetical protein